jgi:hypothetical protein
MDTWTVIADDEILNYVVRIFVKNRRASDEVCFSPSQLCESLVFLRCAEIEKKNSTKLKTKLSRCSIKIRISNHILEVF